MNEAFTGVVSEDTWTSTAKLVKWELRQVTLPLELGTVSIPTGEKEPLPSLMYTR